ncbi:MAG: tRNA 4-thiouridine(8) synthase ThiI [Planctomycetes bacterium]|nr:tRNA 4-thiouridine(8) synthase ThiI [Planctomycetota bacterium]
MSSNFELILIRYGELALKGGNRAFFEKRLADNAEAAAKPIARTKVYRERGRMTAELKEFPERAAAVARRLQEVPGISSVSLCFGLEPDAEAISEVVNEKLAERLEFERGPVRFRVASRRSDKRFPKTSVQLDRWLADRIPEALWPKLVVDLDNPEIEIGVEVRDTRAFVYLERLEGVGGLPVGTLGRAVCLLSGGIDSPVAAYMAMRRGCRTSFVSFLSPPYIGDPTKQKILSLVRKVGRFQPRNFVHFVPFTEIQEAIRDQTPAPYRTVLYRRMMQRLASRIARRNKAHALITGESIGQVASQTLENIACIEAAAALPVIRPLICFDKVETVALAKRIGTLEISNQPEPDCCTVFMPPAPIIRGRIVDCLEAEAALDMDGLVRRALVGTEKIEVEAEA